MRVAVIIHGEPRFCEEFDHLINSLKDIEQVDWFFYLWNKNPYPSEEEIKEARVDKSNPHTFGFNVVAPMWRNVDPIWAIRKLRENIPAEHNIVKVTFADHNNLTFNSVTTNFAEEVSITNICKNWYSLKQVDLLRQEYEKEHGFKYDLVVRSRPDIAVTSEINFEEKLNQINERPNLVLIPTNRRCGYDGIQFCDLYAIAGSDTMSVYSDVINQAWDHHKEGVKFHGETMMAHHISRNDRTYEIGHFTIELRWLGEHFVEPYKIYVSKFGRWA